MRESATARVRFIDPRAVVGPVPFPVLVWKKEVNIKGGMENKQLLSKMKTVGVDVGKYAEFMIRDQLFVTSRETLTKNLVCCEIGDIGFSGGDPTVPEFLTKVKEIKGICSMDTGPHLRYQFMDQSVGEWALVAMEPIPMSFTRGIFFLGCSNGNGHHRKLWIEGCAIGEKGRLGRKLKVIVAR